ncbi:MAG: hypothetical protein AB7H88_17785, partial [Vicinamibacterales bacterium]
MALLFEVTNPLVEVSGLGAPQPGDEHLDQPTPEEAEFRCSNDWSSVDTSNPAIDRQFKTGHFCRSTETHAVLLRQRLSAQVGVDFG